MWLLIGWFVSDLLLFFYFFFLFFFHSLFFLCFIFLTVFCFFLVLISFSSPHSTASFLHSIVLSVASSERRFFLLYWISFILIIYHIL